MTISLPTTGSFAARLRRVFHFRSAPSCALRETALAAGTVWSCELEAGQSIACLYGVLWLTQTGDSTDYLLRAGQSFTAGRRGRVAVQAMSGGTFALRNVEGGRPR